MQEDALQSTFKIELKSNIKFFFFSTKTHSNKLYIWFLKVAIGTSAHATCGETVVRSTDHVGVLMTSVDEKQGRMKGKQRSSEQE